ncbi:hypothetical protein ACSL9G_000851 [Vibrio fluvialis]
MKRATKSFRLQMIKEVALRKQSSCTDPMANYIRTMLSDSKKAKPQQEAKRKFIGAHFDEHAGGWVSDLWALK